jgi:hypothetical protein
LLLKEVFVAATRAALEVSLGPRGVFFSCGEILPLGKPKEKIYIQFAIFKPLVLACCHYIARFEKISTFLSDF